MSNTIYSDQIKVNCPLIHDKDGYYHLIYCITNKKNGKIYIGKHSTKNPYDKYMGSGINIERAIKKYKLENFTKELIFCFTDENEAFLKEAEIVTQEFVDRDDTYNIITGGYGLSSEDVRGEKNPNFGKHLSEETKKKLSETHSGKRNGMYGKKHTQEARNKMSNALKVKMAGEKNPFYGKKHAQASKDKISQNHADVSGEKNPFYGKKHAQTLIDKLSEINSGEKNPNAKAILKMDENNNVITEYGTVKECCELECIYGKLLRRLIKEHILYNGFYFEFKPKTN